MIADTLLTFASIWLMSRYNSIKGNALMLLVTAGMFGLAHLVKLI